MKPDMEEWKAYAFGNVYGNGFQYWAGGGLGYAIACGMSKEE